MGNPLFNIFGGNNSIPGNFGMYSSMIQQFNEFRKNYNGDPKQEVQRLLNSGKMSQAQFNQLQQMATQMMGLLK